jgi:predicted aminopeptidase
MTHAKAVFPRSASAIQSTHKLAGSRAASLLSGVALVAFVLGATGCTGLAYITQAAAGQDDLNRRARDITMLVRDERVGPRMRSLLSQVSVVKKFGERHGLKPTGNYTKYVRIDRPAVVWVVSASEPLRFRSKSWSFPLVGSFTYLGWFQRTQADEFASDLRRAGWDVDVRGSGAYSTAGFFEDAVLSTMIPEGKEAIGQLANTILHESAHATFFVRNQSSLNESVANFIGDRLGEAYVEETFGEDSGEASSYRAAETSSETRGRAMQAAYAALEVLYASNAPEAVKLAEKRSIVDALRAKLRMNRPIGNATLIQYKTYNSGQEELAQLLSACGSNFRRFVTTLRQLETASFAKAQEADVGVLVSPLVASKCGADDAPRPNVARK